MKSYLSPKTKVKKSAISGRGLLAVKPFKKGELVSIKSGHIIDGQTKKRNEKVIGDSDLQIADDFFLAPLSRRERATTMMYLNHSCDANVGLEGNIVFIAMRDIRAGEELTIDYAMFDDTGSYVMTCRCGTTKCRGTIRGGDWRRPELQKRYRGYFSAFIQRKMDEAKRK
ncbi:MAG: SET domain-containing protein-lysine N-methyltransferase [Patescibacteria group bacterium]|nr:SET domain-containing protein-lysine N-methyltransferase [Patescibacteria group bacterium]